MSVDIEVETEVRDYTIRICDACMRLDGAMCHNPSCVFCRLTMSEVRAALKMLTLRDDAIGYVAPADDAVRWQALVREWHEKFGVVIGDSPVIRRPDHRGDARDVRGYPARRSRLKRSTGCAT
jgi:hypothetical protein